MTLELRRLHLVEIELTFVALSALGAVLPATRTIVAFGAGDVSKGVGTVGEFRRRPTVTTAITTFTLCSQPTTFFAKGAFSAVLKVELWIF